ncbi:MAG: hypothetical protein K0Q49_1005 [Haloplasmataceae bacterium]|nr:hypothetical protein [Haloplasmataceae bacterium]
MFRVIKLDGKIDFEIDVEFVVGFEYIEPFNVTLLYCFCTNYRLINHFYENIQKQEKKYLLPQSYHDVYLKNYYYDEHTIMGTNKNGIRLFKNHQFININYFIFFETKIKHRRIKEKIEFSSIDELKILLIEDYGIKYLVPFFYSIREMKEFMVEKRIKVKDVNLLYLLENKTLEGKKR